MKLISTSFYTVSVIIQIHDIWMCIITKRITIIYRLQMESILIRCPCARLAQCCPDHVKKIFYSNQTEFFKETLNLYCIIEHFKTIMCNQYLSNHVQINIKMFDSQVKFSINTQNVKGDMNQIFCINK